MWQTIARGDSTNVGNINLESGSRYRLIVDSPFSLPSWIAEQIANAVHVVLNQFGISGSVSVGDRQIVIEFYT